MRLHWPIGLGGATHASRATKSEVRRYLRVGAASGGAGAGRSGDEMERDRDCGTAAAIALRVRHLQMLAEIYGLTHNRLFVLPADEQSQYLFRRAAQVIVEAEPEAVEHWLTAGEMLTHKSEIERP